MMASRRGLLSLCAGAASFLLNPFKAKANAIKPIYLVWAGDDGVFLSMVEGEEAAYERKWSNYYCPPNDQWYLEYPDPKYKIKPRSEMIAYFKRNAEELAEKCAAQGRCARCGDFLTKVQEKGCWAYKDCKGNGPFEEPRGKRVVLP